MKNGIPKQMPSWANSLIIIAGVGVVGLVLYSIYERRKRRQEERESSATVSNVSRELRDLQRKGGAEGTVSWPQSRYQTAANSIAKLLDGCEMPSTELKVVEEVATVVKKRIDWLMLIQTFGVRKIDDCGPTGETTYDLPTLLKDQLDSFIAIYRMDINGYKKTGSGDSINILKGYLASKGVSL
jgi:hypothetical protein